MSNYINDVLLDEAHFHISYWEGTPTAELIRKDLETNDLEMLNKHLSDSRQEMFLREYTLEPQEIGDVF